METRIPAKTTHLPADTQRSDLQSRYAELAGGDAGQRTSGCGDPTRTREPTDSSPDLPAGLGCGDPGSFIRLQPGQVVLDLGSGAGRDCFAAARQVGSQGKVIGVDMTPEMIEQAKRHATRLGLENVDFRLGVIERLPVEDESVDVVLSNCVLNLSAEPGLALAEAFRVLRPGGLLSVSDMMLDRPVPEAILRQLPGDGACLGGALDQDAYMQAMIDAGFESVRMQRRHVVSPTDAPAGGPTEGEVRLQVSIAETGETVAALSLPIGTDVSTLPRSMTGQITARKPTRETGTRA